MLGLNEKPRSTVLDEITGDHIYFKMREGTGDDLNDSSAQGIFTDDKMTLDASGSGQWGNEGWFTPDGTNHSVLIPDFVGSEQSGISEFLDFTELHGVGGVLFIFDLWCEAVPVGDNEYIFSYHASNTAVGGFAFRLSTGGYLQLQWRTPAGNTNISLPPISLLINGGAGQRNSIVTYIDLKNVVSGSPDKYNVYNYYNGTAKTVQQVDTPLPTPDNTSPHQGFSLLADNNGTGVVSLLNSAATPSNSRVNELFIKRCDEDALSYIADIASEHNANRFDLPRNLLNIA